MKMMLMLVMCGILAGCDYTVLLVRESKTEIDKTLVGLWQRTNDKGQPEHLLILPLGTREYLVSFLSGTEAESSIFARACLCKVDTVNLVQIENMRGPTQLKHHIVGNIHQRADTALTATSQAVDHPCGCFGFGIDMSDHPAAEATT